MEPQTTHTTTDLARRIDQNLEKICKAKFGHVLTQDEWKALPFAVRRELDKQARQKANHSLSQR